MNQSLAEKEIVSNLLAYADVKINGDRTWDIQVHDNTFYGRILAHGSLGLGESYTAGQWDCPNLDQLFYHILNADLDHKIKPNLRLGFYYIKNKLFNLQKKADALKIKHYDLGNDLYTKMLDKRMVYTCGYWANTNDLDSAQEAKLDLVCRKIGLKPGMKVLDIGCGWGSFMKYAAQKYGVSCVGVTISQPQVDLGRELCKGLPVEFRLQDYRDLSGEFDAVVSLGMFEHVGQKNHRTFMKIADKCLKKDGLFLLHCIGCNSSELSAAFDPWIDKYIFAQGRLPSLKQIGQSIENIFIMEDWHNFGSDYDKTLLAWDKNFEENWPSIKYNYDPTFFRMWKYYLLCCAGSFRARNIQLWQIVLTKKGLLGGHKSVR